MAKTEFATLDFDALDEVSGGVSVRHLGLVNGMQDPMGGYAPPGANLNGTVAAGTGPLGVGGGDDFYGAPTAGLGYPPGGNNVLGFPQQAPQQYLPQQFGPPQLAPAQANPYGGIVNAIPGVINGFQSGNPLAAIGPLGNIIGQATGNPQIGQIAGQLPRLISGLSSGNPLSAIGPLGNIIGQATGNPQIGQIAGAVTPLLGGLLGGGGGAQGGAGGLGNLFGGLLGGGGGAPQGGAGGIGNLFGGGGGGGGGLFGGLF